MPAGFGPEASQKIETIPTTNDMSRAEKERWANCAAVYVRMSTEHQQYSTSNQMDIIREYAKRRGFTIVKVYSDEGKSGLNIQGRDSLAQMIRDVQEGKAQYSFILVYDVSRWGRFQDADESAYYEYICRRAGVSVHYCAEQFENDGSPMSSVMKTMKRTMAGEYSRELSTKVFQGACRLIQLVAPILHRQQGGRICLYFPETFLCGVAHDQARWSGPKAYSVSIHRHAGAPG
jgi:predicted site-specific integrase-resolvase